MGRFCRTFLLTVLLCGWAVGCASKPMMTKQPKPPPPDPLLMSKKPIEGKPRASDWEPVTRFDPAPPAVPALPPLPPGRQFTAPGLQRDPVSGTHIGHETVPHDARTQPVLKPTANK